MGVLEGRNFKGRGTEKLIAIDSRTCKDDYSTSNDCKNMQPKILGMFLGMYKNKKPRKGRLYWLSGGEGGIRTHGTLRYA